MLSLSLLRRSVSKSHTRYVLVQASWSRTTVRVSPTTQKRGYFRTYPSAPLINVDGNEDEDEGEEEKELQPVVKLCIRGWPKDLKTKDIRAILEDNFGYGSVISLSVPTNTFFGKGYGIANVEFEADVAKDVMEKITKEPLNGFKLEATKGGTEITADNLATILKKLNKAGKPAEGMPELGTVDEINDIIPDMSDDHTEPEIPEEPIIVFEKIPATQERHSYEAVSRFTLGKGEVTWTGPTTPYAEHWKTELLRLQADLEGEAEETEKEQKDSIDFEEEEEEIDLDRPWKEERYTELLRSIINRQGVPEDIWTTYHFSTPAANTKEGVNLSEARYATEETTELQQQEMAVQETTEEIDAAAIAQADEHWIRRDTVLWSAFINDKLKQYKLLFREDENEKKLEPTGEMWNLLKNDELFSPYDVTLSTQEPVTEVAKEEEEEKKYSFTRNKNEERDYSDYTYLDLLYSLHRPKNTFAKSTEIIDEIVNLWQTDKIEDLFGRPGLLYQRMVPDYRTKTVQLDVVFPFHYSQQYYDEMFHFIVKPYLSALFGVPEPRIAQLELEEYGPVEDVRYTQSNEDYPWEAVMEEIIPKYETEDWEFEEPEQDYEKNADSAFLDVINPAKLDLTSDVPSVDMRLSWDYKWDETHRNRVKAREAAVDASFTSQIVEDFDSNPWVKSARE